MAVTSSEWLAKGWVTEHHSSPQEVEDLLVLADRDLATSETPGLDPDWAFAIAYNGALQLATLALAASGYRASRQDNHVRTIDSLSWTLGAPRALILRMQAARRKRNQGYYERAGLVSAQEVSDMRALAVELRELVMDWMRREHLDLLRS